jgi:hypothetical protein
MVSSYNFNDYRINLECNNIKGGDDIVKIVPKSDTGLYIVRLYDGFDHEWIDITKPITEEEALKVWNEKTKNGTEKTCFNDIDYYDIFPSDVKMLFSEDLLYGKK